MFGEQLAPLDDHSADQEGQPENDRTIDPVSYTHLDVYKRQELVAC